MTLATYVPAAFQPARAPAGARPMQPGSMHAWDREWKRAEVAAWFRGTSPAAERGAEERSDVHSQPDAAATHGHLPGWSARHVGVAGKPTVSITTEAVAAVRGALASPATAPAHAGSMARTLLVAQPTAASTQPTIDALPCVVGQSHGGAGTATPVAAAASSKTTPTPSPTPSPTDAPAVQVHLERDGEGVRVWLGIPASEQAALRAPALVGALRRSLASEGYRLSTVVCNGAPYPDAPQPVSRAIRHIKEQP